MKSYLDIVHNVLHTGQWKGNRTKYRTLATFCEIFRHDMSKGFPLLTTKKMAVKAMAVELEGFIKGVTDKSWYQERKCKIWNEWANPKEVDKLYYSARNLNPFQNDEKIKTKKQIQEKIIDLGPIYGYQWRKFDQHFPNRSGDDFWDDQGANAGILKVNGVFKGTDQLKKVVETLKTNPDDRRMVVSAWNPNQIHLMALPPCHYAFTLVHINGVLNLCWKQRSCDLMLGVPFNIASYALLLELLCKESGLKAGELVGVLEDCHIYENQIDGGAKEQLTRTPRKLPQLKISGEPFDIFNWTYEDFELVGYDPHPKIDFGAVAV